MKNREGSWSIIIPGHWNKYILNPSWVGKNLFLEDEVRVEFPVNNPDLPPRYVSSNKIIFVPANHRVSFMIQDPSDNDLLKNVSSMVTKLAELLPHTPIFGLGINNGFEHPSNAFDSVEIFQFKDSDDFIDFGCTPKNTEIKRQFEYNGKIINLSISNNNEIICFDFNYHYDIINTVQAIDTFKQDILIETRDTSIKILKDVYQLSYDEGV